MNTTPGFELDGRFHACASGKEVLLEALSELGRRHPSALDRLVEEYGYATRERHLVAHRAEAVYPLRPDLAHEVSEFLPGYFAGTNENSDTKLEVLMRLCYFAGLEYGRDFRAACLEGDGSRCRQLEHEFAVSRRLGWDRLGL
jgi:hypothetical protein